MDKLDTRIGFIGAGNMAHAMIKALLSNGGQFESDVVFLCVKPMILMQSVKNSQPFIQWANGQLIVIFVLAGTPVQTLADACQGPGRSIYRIMTNTACALGAANCAVVRHDEQNISNDELVLKLTRTFGQSDFMPEHLMDAFCGIAGSGIAFGYTFIQAMADGAVKMGIPRQQALQIAAQTIMGACRMVLETGKHPYQLRDEVASPGGTTIAGLHQLDKNAVSSGIIEAVEAATKRGQELSRK